MEIALQGSRSAAPASHGSVAIAIRDLRRDYGDRPVLRGVTIDVAHGETLAVLGPNGAGKTTLLRVLATLLRPTAGVVEVLGAPVPAQAWRARGRIGYLGHEALLYRDLSVRENLLFNARLHGIESPQGRIAELLDRVGLARRGDELVRNLSAGMRQRAAICRTLLHDPPLLLLDEPRSHLDVDAARGVEAMLGPAEGRTRVLVTHEIERGLAEGDRVLALRVDGTVAYAGAAAGFSPGKARAVYS
jgi:heme exporter protein A